jgi:hypothetical protein
MRSSLIDARLTQLKIKGAAPEAFLYFYARLAIAGASHSCEFARIGAPENFTDQECQYGVGAPETGTSEI